MSVSVVPTLQMERQLASDGYDFVVGFDEVGRGSLAGPVMVGAAAVRAADLPDLEVPEHVADSKMLTQRRREEIFEPLKDWCAAWAVGAASAAEIDEWGISHALGIAALRALAEAERKLGIAANPQEPGVPEPLFDGEPQPPSRAIRVGAILDGPNDYISKALGSFDAPDVPVPAHVVTRVKGDQHCASVAAAAVIAKVTRDRLMVSLAARPEYAAYGWEHNKGYGSAVHRAAIAERGPSDLHRLSWKLS